ncbi:serpin-ZXA-like [Quercus lobata]|uniref:Serpin domain-containing protein n=1 Tax=Quercus lobata TaxID=97700 RepID=A0A7N2LQ81_QUELO|nr:serpin-ZXA-like [Quercus lobata]
MELGMHMAWQLALNEINQGGDKNVVMSPISIGNALNLLAFGSWGRTLEQFMQFLGAKDLNDLKAKSMLMVEAVAPIEGNNQGLSLASLNTLWTDQAFSLKPSFKEFAKTVFKAEAQTRDFVNQAEMVRNEVNLWAKSATKGLIKELLPHGIINQDTILILANALYFKGAWLNAFNVKLTRHEDFYPLHGKPIRVPFMIADTEKKHFYGSFKNFKVVKIPYRKGQDNRQFSMYVILPDKKDGLQDLVQNFNSTPELLGDCFEVEEENLSKMWIPKFKFSYGFDASRIMQNIGLTLPFEMVGDFTGMIDSLESDKVFLSTILHQSFIEVNEEGTEATALTFAPALPGYSPYQPPPPSFVADHPFIFTIREEISGVVFFVGVVLNPLMIN